MSGTKELLLKVIANLGFKGVSVAMALGMQVMLARWLGPAEYGQFALLQVVCMGLAIYAQAGMMNAYMKLVAELDDLYGLTAVTIVCLKRIGRNLFVAIVLYTGIAAWLLVSGKVEQLSVVVAFAFYLIFQTFLLLLLAWYRGINMAYIASFIEQGSFSGLTVVFGFIWLLIYKEQPALVLTAWLFAVSALVVFILASLHWGQSLKRHKTDDGVTDTKRIAELSRRFVTTQLASFMTNWSGVIIVGAVLTSFEVAQLNVAQRLAQIVVFFLIAFNGVIAPRFAKLNAVGDKAGLRALAQRSAWMLTAATLPIVFATVIFGQELLTVFGQDYVQAYPLLLIIMLGQLVNAMTGSVGFLLAMTNHEQVFRNIVLTSSSITVVASFIGTSIWGVYGAAVAVTLGLCINNLTAAFFVYKHLGFFTIPGLHWVKHHDYRF